jgi:putative ABC transport system permease protein
MLALGILLTYSGLSAEQGMPFYLGVSLVVLAFVPLLRWLGLADRLVYTVSGGLIVVWWLLPWSTFDWLLPRFSMDFNIWIVGGIVTVIGATWIVMYNSDLAVRGAMATFGRIAQMAPILKTALTSPLTNRFRTGVTLAMFTLVVFTLVVGGTTTTAFTRAFNDVSLYGGGFDIRASTVAVNPIPDFGAAIDQSPALKRSDFDVIAAQSLVAVEAKQDGGSRDFGNYPLRGVDDAFLNNNTYGFAAIDPAYGSPRAVWQALRDNPNLAVVDDLVAPKREHFDFGNPAPDFQLEGFFLEDGTFKATPIVVRDPQTGDEHKLTVIALLRDVVPQYMIGVTTSQRFIEQDFPDQATPVAHLIRLHPGTDVKATADNLESTFLANGLEATVLRDELSDIVSLNKTFNYLIQGFIGLGLIVGVAALGVISARAVVERRQEIGVMRAIGFEQGRVQISFLIESSMVALSGIVLGTVLGLVLAHNIISDAQSQPSWENVAFTVPWLNLAIIYAVVLGAALVTAFVPARQASRVYPAQALRYE